MTFLQYFNVNLVCFTSNKIAELTYLFSAGSEEAQDQDSLDGQIPSSSTVLPAQHRSSPPPPPSNLAQSSYTKGPGAKSKRPRRLTKENNLSSSESGDENPRGENQQNQSSSHSTQHNNQQSKSALKPTMERAQSNFSHKSAVSKTSKTSKSAGSRPPGTMPKNSLNLNPFSGILWDRREPFTQLWVTLSSMYGKLLVLLMFAFCLIEVMDNKVPPLTFQGFFMMYLYCGSIIAIMCIYITVLLDNCPSVTNSR